MTKHLLFTIAGVVLLVVAGFVLGLTLRSFTFPTPCVSNTAQKTVGTTPTASPSAVITSVPTASVTATVAPLKVNSVQRTVAPTVVKQ